MVRLQVLCEVVKSLAITKKDNQRAHWSNNLSSEIARNLDECDVKECVNLDAQYRRSNGGAPR